MDSGEGESMKLYSDFRDKIRGLYTMARPYAWIKYVALGLLGLSFADLPLRLIPVWSLLLSLLGPVLIYIALVLVVDLYHKEEDEVAKPYRPLVQKLVNAREILAISLVIVLFLFILAVIINLQLLIPLFLGVVFSIIYAISKQNMPMLTIVARGVLAPLIVITACLVNREYILFDRYFIFTLAGVFFMEISGNLIGHLSDYDQDLGALSYTFAVRYGKMVTAVTSFILLAFSLFLIFSPLIEFTTRLPLASLLIILISYKLISVEWFHKIFRAIIQPGILLIISMFLFRANILVGGLIVIAALAVSSRLLYYYNLITLAQKLTLGEE